jgi:hypothetical protein
MIQGKIAANLSTAANDDLGANRGRRRSYMAWTWVIGECIAVFSPWAVGRTVLNLGVPVAEPTDEKEV